MHDDFRRFCRRALFQTFFTFFFSQFGFLFFLPPCPSKRFLLFFFIVWFSVFLAAVLFQTFSIWFFASAVFCFFARRAFSAPFFLLRGSPTVLFSRRSVRLACGKKMEKKSAVATVKKNGMGQVLGSGRPIKIRSRKSSNSIFWLEGNQCRFGVAPSFKTKVRDYAKVAETSRALITAFELQKPQIFG